MIKLPELSTVSQGPPLALEFQDPSSHAPQLAEELSEDSWDWENEAGVAHGFSVLIG